MASTVTLIALSLCFTFQLAASQTTCVSLGYSSLVKVMVGFNEIREINASTNANVPLRCNVTFSQPNQPTNLTYTWEHNGHIILISPSATFTVRNIQSNGGGNYRCRGTGAVTQMDGAQQCVTSYSPNIVINIRPSITTISPPVTTQEDQAFQLTCVAEGHPQPIYRWYRVNNPSVTLTNESVYIKMSAMLFDAGIYACNARNSQGSTALFVEVTVTPRPVVTTGPFGTQIPTEPVTTSSQVSMDASNRTTVPNEKPKSSFYIGIGAIAGVCLLSLIGTILCCSIWLFYKTRDKEPLIQDSEQQDYSEEIIEETIVMETTNAQEILPHQIKKKTRAKSKF